MRLSLQQPPEPETLSPAMSLNTTTNTSSQSADNAYLDPYTTVAEGYQPHTTRWRLLVSKVSTTLHKKTRSSVDENDIKAMKQLQKEQRALNAMNHSQRPVVSLTERNLTEFFNPEYRDEMDVFRNPSERENPFDNPRKRERVGQWIDGLPK